MNKRDIIDEFKKLADASYKMLDDKISEVMKLQEENKKRVDYIITNQLEEHFHGYLEENKKTTQLLIDYLNQTIKDTQEVRRSCIKTFMMYCPIALDMEDVVYLQKPSQECIKRARNIVLKIKEGAL